MDSIVYITVKEYTEEHPPLPAEEKEVTSLVLFSKSLALEDDRKFGCFPPSTYLENLHACLNYYQMQEISHLQFLICSS